MASGCGTFVTVGHYPCTDGSPSATESCNTCFMCFACASAHAKHIKHVKRTYAAQPQHARDYCPYTSCCCLGRRRGYVSYEIGEVVHWEGARCSRVIASKVQPGDREGRPYITFCFSIHGGTKSRRLNEVCCFVQGSRMLFGSYSIISSFR